MSEIAPFIIAETEWVIFKPSLIHGTGGFARVDFPTGKRVIEYLGDGNVSWNPARFLNHSCEPNCEAVLEEGHIWVVSLRAIRAGEELTFNYGYDLMDYREHTCSCGAVGCVGYIVAEEFFGHLRRSNAT
jgi:hypothetical protein